MAVIFRSWILDPVQEEEVLRPGGLRREAHPALLALEALGRDFVVAARARLVLTVVRSARFQSHDAADDDGSVDGNVTLEFVSRVRDERTEGARVFRILGLPLPGRKSDR